MKTLVEYLVLLPADDPRPDDALLAAFRDDHDDAAFARLVQRYGRLVWGVCRRQLPPADAEDAFQATFLALVRHLDRVSGPLGPWLYTVATRAAIALRRRIDRRPTSSDRLDTVAASTPPPSPVDVDSILLALPEKYRSAVVLCYLAGYTQQEAADRLGCPVGTLSARLSRGLAMLRQRAGDEPPPSAPAVPLALSAATVRLAAAVHAGSLAVAPPALVALTEGLFPMRWMTKTAALAACAALAAITAVMAVAMEKPKVDPRRFPPVEAWPKDGAIVLWNGGAPLLLRSNGREFRRLKGDYPSEGRDAAFSPDGELVAVLLHDEEVMLQRNVFARRYKMYVRRLDGKGPGVELPADDLSFRGQVGWSPDGKRVYAMFDTVISEAQKAVAAGKKVPHAPDRAAVFDLATKKRTVLPLPYGHWLLGERADGNLVTTAYDAESRPPGRRAYLVSPAGKVLRSIERDASWSMMGNDHLSPDGRRVLSTLFDDKKQATGLGVLDLADGSRKWLTVPGLPEKHYFIGWARWSPDGKKIAFYYMAITEEPDVHWSRWMQGTEATLCVMDADGKNLKVIRKGKAQQFYYFEWK